MPPPPARVLNATFNTISAISWWSVLLVEETRVPEENHWPAASPVCDSQSMKEKYIYNANALYEMHLNL
jgi:hypothetical protein